VTEGPSWVPRAQQVLHVEAEVLDLVEPADVHRVEMPVRFQASAT
jgi:hypothetical protein